MPLPTKAEIATRKRHDRLMTLVEAGYIRAIVRAKNRYITRIAEAYKIGDGIPEYLTFEHSREMFALGNKYNSRIIKIIGRDVTENTIKNNNLCLETKQDAFDKWLALIIASWINDETATAAQITAYTTREDIRNAIRESFENGESSASTVKRILKVKGLSAFRADVIARTETHNAAMFANKEAGKRLSRDTGNVFNKVWVSVEDSRTRDSHRAMISHEAINMESLFNVGGDRMDRPGDPRGSARNVINCRCTLAYRVAK